jgi:hypothetical protein
VILLRHEYCEGGSSLHVCNDTVAKIAHEHQIELSIQGKKTNLIDVENVQKLKLEIGRRLG